MGVSASADGDGEGGGGELDDEVEKESLLPVDEIVEDGHFVGDFAAHKNGLLCVCGGDLLDKEEQVVVAWGWVSYWGRCRDYPRWCGR